MNLLYITFVCVLFFLYVWVLYNAPVLAVGVKHLKRSSTRKNKPESNPEKLPTFSIVVPVRDEERVVGRLLKALFKLDYSPEKREIIIVEDGSLAVFDAYNIPETDVLLRAAEYFEDSSVAAVQGTPCAINANENMLTNLVSYEEAVRFAK